MTKAEICRAIAEKLEPKPFFDMPPYPEDGELLISNEGFWTFINTERETNHPVDFFTDESANARLLDAMPSPLLDGLTLKDGKRIWTCIADQYQEPYDQDQFASKDDRRTAIVLAACRWLGLEVGEVEE